MLAYYEGPENNGQGITLTSQRTKLLPRTGKGRMSIVARKLKCSSLDDSLNEVNFGENILRQKLKPKSSQGHN